VVGVEQWAEIRRMHRVDRLSVREISRRTGLHRKTIRRALGSDSPPRYFRAPVASKLDPFKDWICERLQEDPSIQSLRLREMATELGYAGGKTIFDDYVREVRPRFRSSARSSARSTGLGSWCSAICGSRAGRSRSGTARRAGGGS
jgi:transposase